MRHIQQIHTLKQGFNQASRAVSPNISLPINNEPLVVDIPLQGGKKNKQKLTYVVNEMCKSEAGKMILELAANSGYKLCFDPAAAKEGIYGYADPEGQICALSTKNTVEESIVTMAHELRHAFQFDQKITETVDIYKYDTKSKILLDRAMEADAEGFGCLVAWELKEKGLPNTWNDFSNDYPEVASPFEHALNNDKSLKEARTEAFLGWYDNAERRATYDNEHFDFLNEIAPKELNNKLRSTTASKIVFDLCHDGKDNSDYFTQDPKILEIGKYVEVEGSTLQKFKDYFTKRDKLPGRQADLSLDKLVATPDLKETKPSKKPKPVKQIDLDVPRISLDLRQQFATSLIREKRAKKNNALALALKATRNGSKR